MIILKLIIKTYCDVLIYVKIKRQFVLIPKVRNKNIFVFFLGIARVRDIKQNIERIE